VSDWHEINISDVCRRIGTDLDIGLDDAQIQQRRQEHGPNELIETGRRGAWQIFREQLSGAMVLLLIGTAVISAYPLGCVKHAA
jgi:Ca2+-transporting ATPase